MKQTVTRRAVLAGSVGVAAGIALGTPGVRAEEGTKSAGSFLYCLNTGTISGFKLDIEKAVELIGKAGYRGIEPWIREIAAYQKRGGAMKDLKKRIDDAGLVVVDAIGFAKWAVEDDAERDKGVEEMKRDMDLVAQIGGKRIAAPPAGITDKVGMDPRKIGERYAAIMEAGKAIGVVPGVEFWGGSRTLSRLSEAAMVAMESGVPGAWVLADVFHMYKGGSAIEGLAVLSAGATPLVHMNDYPAEPGRETVTDAHRVFPGDGVGPVKRVVEILKGKGGVTVLSLELFNREYWKRPVEEVLKVGLEKMKEVGGRQ